MTLNGLTININNTQSNIKEKNCKECNKPFTTNKSKKIFCSKNCQINYNNKEAYSRNKEDEQPIIIPNPYLPENTSITVGEFAENKPNKNKVVIEYINKK